MSIHRLIKSVIRSGKYKAERHRSEEWSRLEEARIKNSDCTKRLAQIIFANDTFPSIIYVRNDCVVCCPDGIETCNSLRIAYCDLGYGKLTNLLTSEFVTTPSDYTWHDRACTKTVDQLYVLACALSDRPEAKDRYRVKTYSDDGYIYCYELVRKDYIGPQAW